MKENIRKGVKEYERTNDNKKIHQEKWKKI